MDKICELSQGLAINSKTKHLLVGNSDLPLLRIKDLKDGTREIFVNEQNCPQSCRAYPDDIIYTRTGTLGLVFTGMYGVMHNNCFKIQIDRSRVDKAFFIYYLQQSAFKDRIVQLAKRAAQPDITHKLFKEQAFTFPLLVDQVNIVAKISSVEHCCLEVQKNYKKTILLCNDLKQALLRKAFNGEL
jgi:type I restriction enzyme S subunit